MIKYWREVIIGCLITLITGSIIAGYARTKEVYSAPEKIESLEKAAVKIVEFVQHQKIANELHKKDIEYQNEKWVSQKEEDSRQWQMILSNNKEGHNE